MRGEEGKWVKFEGCLQRNATVKLKVAFRCRHPSVSESVGKLERCAHIGELRATGRVEEIGELCKLESCENWRAEKIGEPRKFES